MAECTMSWRLWSGPMFLETNSIPVKTACRIMDWLLDRFGCLWPAWLRRRRRS